MFGDNHKGFLHPRSIDRLPNIVNTGTLTRRRSDEEDYHPKVGFLHSDGSLSTTGLGISKDKFSVVTKVGFDIEAISNMDSSFIQFLNEIQDVAINFKETMFRYLNVKKIPAPVKDMILKVLENE